MFVADRRNKIKEILFREKSVKVSDLVAIFNVSEETIRRDLNEIEREGFAQKNYGGAILTEELRNIMMVITPVQQRKLEFFKEKDAIGKRAAELVGENQIVILDSGSTTWCIAKHLSKLKDLTIVTNSIDIAQEFSQNDSTKVIVFGGRLMKKSMSLVGPEALVELQKYSADFVFLGAASISLRNGFATLDIYETEIKKAMIDAGQKVVVVADHTKFNKQGLISFGAFIDVDMLITSNLVDQNTLNEIKKSGLEVITCPVGE